MSKRIVVSLHQQQLIAYEGKSAVYTFDCTTASSKAVTPTGSYEIHRKSASYRSHTYNAEMPYAMFFDHDGRAIHASHLVHVTSWLKWSGVNYFGSHGCVRLS